MGRHPKPFTLAGLRSRASNGASEAPAPVDSLMPKGEVRFPATIMLHQESVMMSEANVVMLREGP
jgi:hypothetical protein